jgi:curli biogenesis system outer membrane secretion channel CsgG
MRKNTFLVTSWIVALICNYLLVMNNPLHAEPVTVRTEASGVTQREAIASALILAVEQVTGLKIESNTNAQKQFSSVADDTKRSVTLTQDVQQDIKQQSGGIVSSYEIVSSDKGADGQTNVVLSVTIEKFQAKGSPNDNRRRIIVGAFIANQKAQCDDTIGLQCPNANAFVMRVAERLTSYLTLSRRFAVLDRTQDQEYAKEMNLIQSDDVPLKERVRLGQVLATDYIVVGKLNNLVAATATKTNALTGEVTGKKQFSASVDFQVIDISTRQIKWAGTVKQIYDNVETLAEFSAQTIGESITQTIYPLRAIKIDDPTAIVVNQGSDTIKVGQIFKAYRLGDELKDPYSKESLGRAEQEIAVLKITKVDAKVSYGELQSGAMATGDDILLRRVRETDLAIGGATSKPKGSNSTPFD